ncbi:MAG: outer membrane beta-barrel protein [Paludibacteraceae bacterium]|nr:outer membrane beta-barrel protein [Paludibacteraceae bacterium]
MKKIWILLFVFGCSVSVFSKDLIVTKEGDSIKCKILNTTDNYLYYNHIDKGQVTDSKLEMSQVKYFERGFYKTAKLTNVQMDSIYKPSRWRFGLECGYSRWIAKNPSGITSDLSSYLNGLKNGFNYAADVTYYFNQRWGVGMKYHGFNSSNSLDDYSVTSTDGTVTTGTISDKEWIQYFGPYGSYRYILPNDKRNVLYANLGVGYTLYRDKGAAPSTTDVTITGHQVGVFANLGYDYFITKNFALGVELGFNVAKLSKYKTDDGTTTETVSLDSDSHVSLNTLDVSVGLKYNLK